MLSVLINYDASFLTLLRALRVNLEIMKLGVKWRSFIHAFRLRLMIDYLPCQAKKVTKFIFKVCLTESRNGSITTEDLKTTRREASKFIAFRAKKPFTKLSVQVSSLLIFIDKV